MKRVNNKKILSIIMPIYNSGSTLEKALISVFNQKDENIELVIIDAISNDNTPQIIQKYKDMIDIYVCEKDKGYSDALNKGINYATGKYYMMLAGDDCLIGNALNKALESLKSNTQVWCGSIIMKNKYGYLKLSSYNDLSLLYKGCSLRHPATIFDREYVLDSGGYNIDYKCAADRELFLRLYEKNAIFQIENSPIVFFDNHGMSSTSELPYLEDKKISIQYGMNEKMANKIFEEACNQSNNYQFDLLFIFLSKIKILSHLSQFLNLKDIYLTKKQIHNLKLE